MHEWAIINRHSSGPIYASKLDTYLKLLLNSSVVLYYKVMNAWLLVKIANETSLACPLVDDVI